MHVRKKSFKSRKDCVINIAHVAYPQNILLKIFVSTENEAKENH